MKSFKFKLQPVLDHRQKKEDIRKKELADAKQRFETEQSVLKDLEAQMVRLHAELKAKRQSDIDSQEATWYAAYMEKIESKIELQQIRVAELEAEVRGVQERLLEASKDKKVLEKLHDRKLDEYKREYEKNDQAQIDELATVRYKRG